MTKHVDINAVGDISFMGYSTPEVRQGIFKAVKDCFGQAGCTVGNLESPLTRSLKAVPGKYTLRGDPSWAAALRENKFSLVSLANNHIMDHGEEGLYDTLDSLNKAGVKYIGAGRNQDEAFAPAVLSIEGREIAFIARTSVVVSSKAYAGKLNPGAALFSGEEVVYSIKECKRSAAVVVLMLHWGLEQYYFPSPQQRELAQRLIDAGVDVLIGHHPHVVQGVERYKNGLIAYSLGNFLFNDFIWELTADNGKQSTAEANLPEDNKQGMILRLGIDEGGVFSHAETFTRINDAGCILIDRDSGREKDFKKLSHSLGTKFYSQWWRLYALRTEWSLRIKPRLPVNNLCRNIRKIRPRHLFNLAKILKKSISISSQKTTNPYE